MSASTTEPPGSTSEDEPTTTGPDSMTSTGEESTSTSTSTGADSSSSTTAAQDCRLQLVEVLFDAVGDDDMLQWVKLYNPCSDAFDLNEFTVAWAGGAWDFGTMTPDYVIESGECAVVGGPTADAANGSPTQFQHAEDFMPSLRLAPDDGSGVALFDVAAGEVGTAIPIDAVIYGDNNDAGLIDTSGAAAAGPHVGLSAEGGSIRRTAAEETWEVAKTPSPDDCPPY
jgi:hypothetical protein